MKQSNVSAEQNQRNRGSSQPIRTRLLEKQDEIIREIKYLNS